MQSTFCCRIKGGVEIQDQRGDVIVFDVYYEDGTRVAIKSSLGFHFAYIFISPPFDLDLLIVLSLRVDDDTGYRSADPSSDSPDLR